LELSGGLDIVPKEDGATMMIFMRSESFFSGGDNSLCHQMSKRGRKRKITLWSFFINDKGRD